MVSATSSTSHLRPAKRPSQNRDNHNHHNHNDDGETASLQGSEEKHLEEERLLLDIHNLNTIPDSLGRYSLRATAFHFGQAAILFYFASQSDTKWRWFTNYPYDEPEENDALSAPPQMPHANEVAYFSILWYSPVFICKKKRIDVKLWRMCVCLKIYYYFSPRSHRVLHNRPRRLRTFVVSHLERTVPLLYCPFPKSLSLDRIYL